MKILKELNLSDFVILVRSIFSELTKNVKVMSILLISFLATKYYDNSTDCHIWDREGGPSRPLICINNLENKTAIEYVKIFSHEKN